jgi:hypothetical protein
MFFNWGILVESRRLSKWTSSYLILLYSEILNKVIYVTKQAIFKRRSRVLGLSFMSAFPALISILLERLR